MHERTFAIEEEAQRLNVQLAEMEMGSGGQANFQAGHQIRTVPIESRAFQFDKRCIAHRDRPQVNRVAGSELASHALYGLGTYLRMPLDGVAGSQRRGCPTTEFRDG